MGKRETLYSLILRRRTIRLFKQKEIPLSLVKKAVNAGRLAPSAANLQFLEYLIVDKPKLRQKVFPHTFWAGYLYPRRVPPSGKRPTLYIVILINKERFTLKDLREIGAAAENIMLALLAKRIGSCWIGRINESALKRLLKIPAKYKIDSLIAAGYPAEKPKLEIDARNVKYWLDGKNRLHVPKRPLKDLIHFKAIQREL